MTSGQGEGRAKRSDATRTALIEAAERLIAKKGLADVSTREILEEAEQRNQSALQYHFGSKNGLIQATIDERTNQIDRYRLELLDEVGDDPTLEQVLQIMVIPLCKLIEQEDAGKNYLIFLAQAITQPEWDLRAAIKDFEIKGLERAFEHYDRLLSHFNDDERILKQAMIFDLNVLTLKRWCLSEPDERSSLQYIHDFVIKSAIAIIKA